MSRDNRGEAAHCAILSMGSNVPQGREILENAISALAADPATKLGEVSEIYDSEPLSGSGPRYVNAVASILTPLDHDTLNRRLKLREEQSGRDAEARKRGIVPLDLDIVVFDGETLRPKDFNADFFRRGYSQLILSR